PSRHAGSGDPPLEKAVLPGAPGGRGERSTAGAGSRLFRNCLTGSVLTHSYCRAIMGATFVARHAGSANARNAIKRRTEARGQNSLDRRPPTGNALAIGHPE